MGEGATFRLDGRRVELDGARGVAILLVLLCHLRIPGLYAAGATGVTVFFVLSGFLISSLLLEEHRSSGGLSFQRFYARRARRLGPALAVWAGAVTLVGVAVGSPAWLFQWRYLLASLTYVGNWVLASGGWLGAFNGTWSLAVEEQFYVVLPLLAALVLRRGERAFACVAGAVLVLSIGVRLYLLVRHASVMEVYYRTDTSTVGLAAGSLLAVGLRSRPMPLRAVPPAWAAGVLLAVVAWVCTRVGDPAFGVVPVLASAGGVLLVAGALGRSARWLRVGPLVWLGERSYGVYLWHMVPSWVLADRLGLSWPVVAVGTLLVALPAAELSWRFVELPVLRRRRPSERRTEAAAVPSPA